MRVGTIESVHDVAGSSKLARFIVDFGDHKRTVLAGMKKERADLTEIRGPPGVVRREPGTSRDGRRGLRGDVLRPRLRRRHRPGTRGSRAARPERHSRWLAHQVVQTSVDTQRTLRCGAARTEVDCSRCPGACPSGGAGVTRPIPRYRSRWTTRHTASLSRTSAGLRRPRATERVRRCRSRCIGLDQGHPRGDHALADPVVG